MSGGLTMQVPSMEHDNDRSDTERERKLKLFTVNLDDDDRDLLDRVAAREKLTRSDILRIALRRYAKELGLETKPAA